MIQSVVLHMSRLAVPGLLSRSGNQAAPFQFVFVSILRLVVPGLLSRSGSQAAEYFLFVASIAGYCASCWVVVARFLACLLACLPARLLACLPAAGLAWPFFSLLSLLPRGLSSDVRFGPIVTALP